MVHGSGSTIKPSTSTLDAALAYLRAGLSIVPVGRDGSKKPTLAWKVYQGELASEEDARLWFGGPSPQGIAVIGGAVSGNLEQIDFDQQAQTVFPAWKLLVEAEQPGLLDKLSI